MNWRDLALSESRQLFDPFASNFLRRKRGTTMVKRIIGALIAVSVFGLTAHEAGAQQTIVAVDGCTKLARVVYAEVSAAALYGPGRSGPWIIDSGQGEISICTHTVKTVSRAFTSAMRSAGFDVSWDGQSIGPGDYCLGGFISQCYPDRGPQLAPTLGSDTAFVQKSWAIVSQSVMREMYNPFSSDEVRFRDNDLKLRLGLSLRLVAANPQFQAHPNLQ